MILREPYSISTTSNHTKMINQRLSQARQGSQSQVCWTEIPTPSLALVFNPNQPPLTTYHPAPQFPSEDVDEEKNRHRSGCGFGEEDDGITGTFLGLVNLNADGFAVESPSASMTSIGRLESGLAHAKIPVDRRSMRVVQMECEFGGGSCELGPGGDARKKKRVSRSKNILTVPRTQIKDKDRPAADMWPLC